MAIALLTVILKAGKSAQNFVNAHCRHYLVKGLVFFDILGVKNSLTGRVVIAGGADRGQVAGRPRGRSGARPSAVSRVADGDRKAGVCPS